MNNEQIKDLIYKLIEYKLEYPDKKADPVLLDSLEAKSGENFGENIRLWVEWYLSSGHESGRSFIEKAYLIYKSKVDFSASQSGE